MRIDLISIFPEYFAPLDLSLPGKARERGLLEVHAHDLRSFTRDRHRTVDDTPYGGGAGMVMKPEPWGEALDALAPDDAVLVVPTPAGKPFGQAMAAELAAEPRLVFACGRYEGIDQRVLDEAALRLRVREVSLGDYVLNGGEVAALAIVEAVVRLLPGFMGNADSLVEESHADGLLEYPVYTKPQRWRDREVPEVLLSGDHARIAGWRRDRSRERTAARRPDLLLPSSVLGDLEVAPARPGDAGELLTLRLAGRARALEETGGPGAVEATAAWVREREVMLLRSAGRLIGCADAVLREGRWVIGSLEIVPDLHADGLDAATRGAVGALVGALAGRAPAGAPVEVHLAGRDLVGAVREAGYRSRGEVVPGVLRMVPVTRP